MKISDNQTVYINTFFKDINFCNEKIEKKEFDNCTFTRCNFSSSEFIKCKFLDCAFKECNLSLIKVNQSKFFDVVFEDSKLIGINWTMAAWPSIKLSNTLKFHRCIINDNSFLGLFLKEIVILECKAHDVDFRDADCSQADFSYSDFKGCLFSNTNLTEANFEEAINYSINVFSNVIKKAKFTLPEAVNLLQSLDIELLE